MSESAENTVANNTGELPTDHAAAEKAPASKKRRLGVALAVLALGAVVVGVPLHLHFRLYESTDDAFIEGHVAFISPKVAGHVVRVAVDDNQQVGEGDLLFEIDSRDYEARLQQARGALESAQARHQAAQINVALTSTTATAEFDAATAGLDIAKAAVSSARTQVDAARSRLEQARAQLGTAQATSEQTKADVASAQADATLAEIELKRVRDLTKTGVAARQDLDKAVATSQTAAAKLDSAKKKTVAGEAQVAEARAGVQTAEQGVKQAEAQLKQAQSGVTEAQAHLAQANVAAERVAYSVSQRDGAAADIQQLKGEVVLAELQLSYTKVVAPQAGRVTRKSVEAGAFVQPGQPLLAIVPYATWVVANFKETQLTHMRSGQKATIRIDAYPGLKLTGHVDSIQRGAGARFSLLPPENATGNYVKVVQRVPVKIVLDQPPDKDHAVGPGMSAVPRVRVR
jgi:membrane fusion protein (multidrug efflux system)